MFGSLALMNLPNNCIAPSLSCAGPVDPHATMRLTASNKKSMISIALVDAVADVRLRENLAYDGMKLNHVRFLLCCR